MRQEFMPGLVGSGVCLYTTSLRHVINRDLVPTYMFIKEVHDPMILRGENARFGEATRWFSRNRDLFNDEYAEEENICLGDNVSAATNYWTLMVIHELSLMRVNFDKPVAYSAGTRAWEGDVVGNVKKMYEHVLAGEGKLPGSLMDGGLQPNSTTSSIEIAHRYLGYAQDYEQFREDINNKDREYFLALVLESKDVLMRLLLQSYLHNLVSRT